MQGDGRWCGRDEEVRQVQHSLPAEARVLGLLKQVLVRKADGSLLRKTGVMAVVEKGGLVAPGDSIEIVLPVGERVPLEPV